MSHPIHVGLIIGSLRNDSINRKFAEYIATLLPAHMHVKNIVISDLPLYNQDDDEKQIESCERVRQEIQQSDVILIASPEHNRTMTAALKNVIDIASRPHQKSVWANKKVAIISASPGNFGGINAALDARKSLEALSAKVMIKPEVYLSRATQSLDENGVNSEHTQKFLQQFTDAFISFASE